MAWYDFIFGHEPERIDEATKAFKGKGDDSITDKEWKDLSGEGIEDVALLQAGGYGTQGILGFNHFFNSYLNKTFENEVFRILNYRNMALYPEVGDVIEDACNEACKPDNNLNLINLIIVDEKLKQNQNISKILQKEFEILFFERLDINDNLWELFHSYMIDGRLFYERIVNPNKTTNGIINIKKLPAETMDYELNPINARIMTYYQYLTPNQKRPLNRQEAERLATINKNLVIFNPEQIGFIHYGTYGKTLYEIFGYLEKAKVPYNQLKLLETSVIIYRLVRSPERLMFKIDTGNMPRDKAIKYVERIKQKFVKKQSFNPTTGSLSQEPEVFSVLENYYLPVGCLALYTTIDLLDGRSIPLSAIIKEHEEGKTNYVYTVDQKTGKTRIGEIEWAGITRKNTETIRIYLENNNHIDCTPDHKFLVWKDDSKTEMIEIEAQNLTKEMDIVENV